MFGTYRTPLARRNFFYSTSRLLSALAGVTFAVVLMFVEMGFLNGMYDSQTYIVENFNADLVIVSADKTAVVPKLPFPEVRLGQVRGQPGVAAVYPLWVDEMKSALKNFTTREQYPILVIGMEPHDPAFIIPEVLRHSAKLADADTFLIDSRSKDLYGDFTPGTEGELCGRRVRLAGTFPLGPDFRVDGNVLVSRHTYFNLMADPRTGRSEDDRVEFGLVKLTPGADLETVRTSLERQLPLDVSVLTPLEFAGRVRKFWGDSKPVGAVFGLGMAVGFLIGITICYQILYADISDHLPQYATLKAIGYADSYLLKLVVEEAIYLAVISFLPGVIISKLAYMSINHISGIPMYLNLKRAVAVFLLTVIMCIISGLIAIRKAIEADPAEVF
jgi:putative ABC transport system permease protein